MGTVLRFSCCTDHRLEVSGGLHCERERVYNVFMKSGWKYVLLAILFALGLALHLCCGGGSASHVIVPPAQSHRVDLAWIASTSSVAGYNIYRATQSTGPFTKLSSQPQPGLTYTDNNVQAGQTYYYAVTAVDSNSVESNFSNEVSVTIPTP
jgi:fibronectin type 3 domain-containing protein